MLDRRTTNVIHALQSRQSCMRMTSSDASSSRPMKILVKKDTPQSPRNLGSDEKGDGFEVSVSRGGVRHTPSHTHQEET